MNSENYPAMRYHPSGETRIVHTPEQDDNLGAEWAAKPHPPRPEVSQECDNCRAMRVSFDAAWKRLETTHKALQESYQALEKQHQAATDRVQALLLENEALRHADAEPADDVRQKTVPKKR